MDVNEHPTAVTAMAKATFGRATTLACLVALAAGSSSLGACGRSKDTTAQGGTSNDFEAFISSEVRARDKLKAGLRDPDSARFSEVRAFPVTRESDGAIYYYFCGTMNAKNGFGGYSGATRFFATPILAVVEAPGRGFDELWSQRCLRSDGRDGTAF